MLDSRFDRVLVVAPHSDDAELGCGGLLARLCDEGRSKSVDLVILAVGTQLKRDGPEVKTIDQKTRRQETLDAIKLFDIEDYRVHFMSPFDGHLSDVGYTKAVTTLDEMLENMRPTAFFFNLPSYHQDHRFSFDICFSAIRPNPFMRTVKLIAMYEYPMNVLDYQIPFNSRMYLDLSGGPKTHPQYTTYLDWKLAAYQTHKSQQVTDRFHLLSTEGVHDLARMRGREVGVTFAEKYYLVREVL
jgi:LmbE family N-acetylglucosaminyl deacetylase